MNLFSKVETEQTTGTRSRLAAEGAKVNAWTPPATEREAPDAGNVEEAARDRVLDLHEFTSAQVLDELRAKMRVLYRKRRSVQGVDAFVTADDARLILDTDERFAHLTNKNFMGSLFREKGWEKTGRIIKSRTPGSHANELKCWRWNEIKAQREGGK